MIVSIILLILLIVLALTAMRRGFESWEGIDNPGYHERIHRYSAPHH